MGTVFPPRTSSGTVFPPAASHGGGVSITDRRLRLSDATLYDPNSRLVSASQDANGKMTITVAGSWASTDPKAAIVYMWPVKDANGLDPNLLMTWAVQTVFHELQYPTQKMLGDTWIIVGLCNFTNPASGWNARGSGWRYDSANAARRARLLTETNSGAVSVTDANTSLPTARQIRESWLRSGLNSSLTSKCAIILDGTGDPLGTLATTTNAILELGRGNKIGIFFAIGRGDAANVTSDTIYFQLDTQPVTPISSAAGNQDQSRILNVFPLGDSITQGTGWAYDGNGEIFGWRLKMEQAWIITAGLPVLAWYGSSAPGVTPVVLTAMPSGRSNMEGHSGFTTALMIASLAGYLSALPIAQDVMILGLGTNDAQLSVASAVFVANMQSIINSCRASSNFAAGCKLLVSLPPPLASAPFEAFLVAYRAAMQTTLTGVDGFIDDYTGFNIATMQNVDGVHPNEVGYQFLADKRIAAVRLAKGI